MSIAGSANQKRALRRQRVAERHQERRGDWYNYPNSDLRSIINIGHDAQNVIIYKKQEHEETEAYSPTSNYRIPSDYSRLPRKRLHTSDDHRATSRDQQCEKATLAQAFQPGQTLHERGAGGTQRANTPLSSAQSPQSTGPIQHFTMSETVSKDYFDICSTT